MSTKAKILLIEDEPYILELYSIVLSKAGYEFKVAKDGNDGLEEIKKYRPDLVFLDIMLPHKTGLEILKTVRTDPAYKDLETKIVILTNLADENIIKQINDLHADGYLLKVDISPTDLVDTIESFFGKN
jgi:two-component system, OmpR family, alkaline phosphatase synthesis response regulator PhoP